MPEAMDAVFQHFFQSDDILRMAPKSAVYQKVNLNFMLREIMSKTDIAVYKPDIHLNIKALTECLQDLIRMVLLIRPALGVSSM